MCSIMPPEKAGDMPRAMHRRPDWQHERMLLRLAAARAPSLDAMKETRLTMKLTCYDNDDLEVIEPQKDGSHFHHWPGDPPEDLTACNSHHYMPPKTRLIKRQGRT